VTRYPLKQRGIVPVASPGFRASDPTGRASIASKGRLVAPVALPDCYRISTGLLNVTTAFLRDFSQSLEKPCKRGLRRKNPL
jgi:hypothetical protein